MATSRPTRRWCWPRRASLKPRALAELLAERLRALASVSEVAIAGPGFINFRVKEAFWQARIADVLQAGTAYGSSTVGAGVRVNVEYVSANPTGPLHVAHARGAVFGDALAALLAKAGFAVIEGVLHQRRRRAGRCARPLGLSALSRSARRRHRYHPGGSLSRRLSEGCRPRHWRRATATAGATRRKRTGLRRCVSSPSTP